MSQRAITPLRRRSGRVLPLPLRAAAVVAVAVLPVVRPVVRHERTVAPQQPRVIRRVTTAAENHPRAVVRPVVRHDRAVVVYQPRLSRVYKLVVVAPSKLTRLLMRPAERARHAAYAGRVVVGRMPYPYVVPPVASPLILTTTTAYGDTVTATSYGDTVTTASGLLNDVTQGGGVG